MSATWTSGPLAAMPSRTEAVLDALKHAIISGELQPGQGLVEADLAQRLGVSKTPVREALKTLAGAGLVTMSAYKGAVVRTVDEELARSIYDMRLLLEPQALVRAMSRSRDSWIRQAADALDRAGAAGDQADRSLANRDFHRALYLDCGNPVLVKVLDELRDQTALVAAIAWRQKPSWELEACEHTAILDAARAGDADGAAELLRTHIAEFMNRNFPAPGREEAVRR